MGEIWYPNGTKRVGVDTNKKLLLNVMGKSGVGKSHLIRQAALDPEIGPDKMLVLMSEDSTTTYDTEVPIVRVTNLTDVEEILTQLIAARNEKREIPEYLFWDSVSGTGDWQFVGYDEQQPFRTNNDKRLVEKEYGDFASESRKIFVKLRDILPCDVICMWTTFERPAPEIVKGSGDRPDKILPMVEILVPGRVLPANSVRWSGVCLYMKAVTTDYSPEQGEQPKPALHRTIGMNENGQPLGKVINRYLFTMDTGEFAAKGHHNLALRERAILPDVLRKIHGRESK